jgi:hypothetical protein
MKRLFILCGMIFLLLLFVSMGYAGQATVSWVAPTINENGTPLTDLAGFKIYYGTATGKYTEVLNIDNKNTTSATFVLPNGNWFFAATAYNAAKAESKLSLEVMKPVVATPPFIPPANPVLNK